jgi:hypothetical protein
VLIEPTAARTSLDTNTAWSAEARTGPYADFYQDVTDWHARTYAGPPQHRRTAGSKPGPGRSRLHPRPPPPAARYPVGTLAHGLFALRRRLPAPAFDTFLHPVPRPPATTSNARPAGTGAELGPAA